jgi:ADP-dependent NAD(P)H-hydrate dehydratase / NAD(P)H-hydrate epimerase
VAGAALLAGHAAARAGAGKVWLVSDAENRQVLQAGLPEAIFVDRASRDAVDAALGTADAVVAGPGMGTDPAAAALLERVLRHGDGPLVLDADALTLLASQPDLRAPLGTRAAVLTPHPAEMARLVGTDTAAVVADPAGSATAGARRYRSVVLLKGFPSLVAAGDEPTIFNATGHSGVATGGMGDTLAGATGALFAFGLAPRDAAATALHLCGRAAELAGRGRSLLPRDVAEALPAAIAEVPAEPALPGVLLDLPAAR